MVCSRGTLPTSSRTSRSTSVSVLATTCKRSRRGSAIAD